jgi:hypothetical protein
VIVEWNNVTAWRDLDIDGFQTHEHLMRAGYAWVGVTPQVVGVEALTVWNPRRYGTLDVTHAGTVARDDPSYDIFAQAGQAVRATGRVNVMGGLRVERVFAWPRRMCRIRPRTGSPTAATAATIPVSRWPAFSVAWGSLVQD